MSLTIGSLCTGSGALDMAVETVLDARTVWHAEHEPPTDKTPHPSQAAPRLLAHRFPGRPNLGDITRVDWTRVEPVDVITAGFPCQDISYAGRGAGITEGTRSGLWYAIADAVGVLRPQFVVLENVAAVVTRRPGLDVVLASLACLGFDAQWVCVRASDVGAPHGRNRWFCVAWPAADADSEGRRWRESAAGRDVPAWGVAANTQGSSGRRGRVGFEAASATRGRGTDIGRRNPAADASGYGWDEGWPRPTGIVGGSDAAERSAHALADSDGDTVREQPVAESWSERPAVTRWGIYAAAIRRWERTLGRVAPAPTEANTRGGQRLSPAFVEWMMGLPSGWATAVPGINRNDRLKILGNGVVPQQAVAALRLLLNAGQVAA